MRSRTTSWSARRGAVGQPQLRGPRARQRARQLSGLAAAGGGLRAARHDERGHHHRPARHSAATASRSICKDIWPTNKEIADIIAASAVARRSSSSATARCSRARSSGRRSRSTRGSATYRWNDGSTYVKNPPYFEGITMEPAPVGDITGARILADAGRLHHHRPHQPGRQHPQDLAGRRIPAGAAGRRRRTSTATARAAATTK